MASKTSWVELYFRWLGTLATVFSWLSLLVFSAIHVASMPPGHRVTIVWLLGRTRSRYVVESVAEQDVVARFALVALPFVVVSVVGLVLLHRGITWAVLVAAVPPIVSVFYVAQLGISLVTDPVEVMERPYVAGLLAIPVWLLAFAIFVIPVVIATMPWRALSAREPAAARQRRRPGPRDPRRPRSPA